MNLDNNLQIQICGRFSNCLKCIFSKTFLLLINGILRAIVGQLGGTKSSTDDLNHCNHCLSKIVPIRLH